MGMRPLKGSFEKGKTSLHYGATQPNMVRVTGRLKGNRGQKKAPEPFLVSGALASSLHWIASAAVRGSSRSCFY
jgi:hypothetical protein